MKEKVGKTGIADESGAVGQVTGGSELPKPCAEGFSKSFFSNSTTIAAALGGLTVHEPETQCRPKSERGMVSMGKGVLFMVLLLAGACTVPGRVDAQTSSGSSRGVTSNAAPDPASALAQI